MALGSYPNELGEMLAAIQVPSFHVDADAALDVGPVIGIDHAREQFRVVVDDGGARLQFQAPATFIVDDEQHDAVLVGHCQR